MKKQLLKPLIVFSFSVFMLLVSCTYNNDDDQIVKPEIEEPKPDPTPEPLPSEYLMALKYPNSFMVKPGSSVTFPIMKAFAVWLQYENRIRKRLSREASLTVSLVWQDKQGLISEVNLSKDEKEYSEITVHTTNQKGNAVIALKANNEICWSWHLWVTDYDPDNQIKGKTYPWDNNDDDIIDYIWMDRNLGAETNGNKLTPTDSLAACGLLYQWGRKDPFPGDIVIGGAEKWGQESSYLNSTPIYNISNILLPETGLKSGKGVHYVRNHDNKSIPGVLRSINDPLAFLEGGEPLEPSSEWYKEGFWFSVNSAEYDDTLWNNEGAKGIFDPCPEGWRVPIYKNQMYPWAGFKIAATPYSALGVFPYAGIRDRQGFLKLSGYFSQIWTANPWPWTKTGGICVQITKPKSEQELEEYVLVDVDLSPRDNGLSVRCVRDNQ